MNIAYISADFGVPIFGFKGASVHVREMVTAFVKAGHSVSVISPAMDSAPPPGGSDNPAYLHVPPAPQHVAFIKQFEALDQFIAEKTRIRQELRNLIYNKQLYRQALEYLRSRRVDFVYERYTLFSYAGLQLAKELGVPHLLEINAPLAYEQEKMRGLEMRELAQKAERHIFNQTDCAIVVSECLRKFVASCGVANERIQVLPNSVDPGRFHSKTNGRVRARYRLNGKCVIGFVGSLKPWHGTETLLQAFRELQAAEMNCHLLIVGDGPARADLEKYVQENGLQAAVTFTGKVPYDEIPDHIAAMDVTVAPYIPNENFYYSPIKIFEYMAMARPVVAGKIGQVEEIITDGETGLLFEPGNIAELVSALKKLNRDSALCRRLGEQGRRWVIKERTWDNNAMQVIAIAKELQERKAESAEPKEESVRRKKRSPLDAPHSI